MECYRIEHLNFTYPSQVAPALADISLTVPQGQFITFCGKSGCGKSTLLRQLKSVLAPHGTCTGEVYFHGRPLSQVDARTQSAEIGFVLQSPDNQIVTDKVWHELAFGLESLGCSTSEIRARVAEMASFFGIQTWFHKKVNELSGGQKQLLNLAAIMVMQPSVLILDEPTSQLDPIAAQDFLDTVQKINRELGTTILLTEQRLEEAFPMSDRVVVMDGGRVIADGAPRTVGERLKALGHDMCAALPAPMRVYAGIPSRAVCPVTVREGRQWLEKVAAQRPFCPDAVPAVPVLPDIAQPVLELRDVWFRYARDLPDVIKGLSLRVAKGEWYAIVGGNGTGKTTALSILGGLQIPYRGQVRFAGETCAGRGRRRMVMLPQNPQALFVKKTVALDLYEMLEGSKLPHGEQDAKVGRVAALCGLEGLLERHPYDLSGGEQQRAALAKVLLLEPEILLLDEPTKGLDAHFKQTLAQILHQLQKAGVTVIMVSHDIAFCAAHADRCGMFFDGRLVSEGHPRSFFSGKSFYTTAANRMARSLLPEAILAEDIIAAFGGHLPGQENGGMDGGSRFEVPAQPELEIQRRKTAPWTWHNLAWGIAFGVLFFLTVWGFYGKYSGWRWYLVQAVAALELILCLSRLIPQKQLGGTQVQAPRNKRKLPRRTWAAAAVIIVAVPLTIFVGMYYLDDRKYYFISLLIILETMLPFVLLFEGRRPQARELMVVSVLCAIAVAGRVAFYMLPQFKPVVALVIIAGVCFGGETGFLVGAVTGFVSNFFFGQGPLTPWQMFAFGIIGFLAGILFRKGLVRKTRGSLAIFGALATILVYGGLMNPASVLIGQARFSMEALWSSYAMGLPFDLMHAASTVVFLWVLAGPMIEKLERIKVKYGLLEG